MVHTDVEIPKNFLSISRYPRPLLKTLRKCPSLEGFQNKSFEKINASRSALELCQTIMIQLFTTMVKGFQLLSIFAIYITHHIASNTSIVSHCKKGSLFRFFWSLFCRIPTDYGNLLHKSSCLVGMREDTEQKHGQSLRSVCFCHLKVGNSCPFD